jgi:hypothetical protein
MPSGARVVVVISAMALMLGSVVPSVMVMRVVVAVVSMQKLHL